MIERIIVECHDNERAVTAVEFFERARIFFASHGITVKSVLTDNGSCYISGLWKAACAEAQIKHRRTKRQTPRTNGKVERFNRTMKDARSATGHRSPGHPSPASGSLMSPSSFRPTIQARCRSISIRDTNLSGEHI